MRNIPIDMVADFQSDATTFCRLVKVICKDGTRLAFTTLDAPLAFDDGEDSLVYSPLNGIQPSRFETTGDMSVDNAEMLGWVQPEGITEQQIRAGLFDHAKVITYKVNYLNATPGRMLIEMAGRCGETVFTDTSFKTEFRSKTQQLRQPVGDLTSLTCRVAYGSPPCGKELVWTDGTVTAVDPEAPDQIFTGTVVDDDPTVGYQASLGVVEITSGANAGVEMELELFDAGTITLQFPLPYPLAVDDTYRVRVDCNKTLAMSILHGNVLNMRAEPFTPVSDGAAALTPGAQTTNGNGGSSETEAE